jgi:hypothetical protein
VHTTVAEAAVADLGLGFDCLCAKSPLCIYKQREGSRWESSCIYSWLRPLVSPTSAVRRRAGPYHANEGQDHDHPSVLL